MPALAAKIAVAVAAAVVVWAGIEALRVRHVVAADLPPAAAEPAPPSASEVPKLRNVAAQEMKLEEPQPQVATPWGVAAMARIHGRVLGGGEQGEEEEPPSMTCQTLRVFTSPRKAGDGILRPTSRCPNTGIHRFCACASLAATAVAESEHFGNFRARRLSESP